jgi:hypothetical protein
MPEADITSMLRLIEERIRSREIEVRHRDALIRLRDILENDLNPDRFDGSSEERSFREQAVA